MFIEKSAFCREAGKRFFRRKLPAVNQKDNAMQMIVKSVDILNERC